MPARPIIDLDANATTPLDPRVLEAMRPYWLAGGNPESRHAAGRASRRGYEQAREVVAEVLHAHPDEVVFTSGGTEANNLALFGLIPEPKPQDENGEPPRVVATDLEHPAVAEPLERLAAEGLAVDRVPVGSDGRADVGAMVEALRPTTRLAVLMWANNETGAVQPVAELAQRCGERDAPVPVHTDAVQAVGRIPVDFQASGVATLALSGHKLHGPAGIGALLVRRDRELSPLLLGGGQQRGRRPGTPAVALAVGLAEALRLWQAEAEERTARWRRLRDRLEARLVEALGPAGVVRNGPALEPQRLPQTLNVGLPGLDGDALLMQLDLAGVAVSLGSACASGSTQASPTLVAMGVPRDRLRSSIRLSLHAQTTEADVDEAADHLIAVAQRIRGARKPEGSA